MAESGGAPTYETKAEGLESPGAFVKLWCDALAREEDEEKDWVKKAEDTYATYRGSKKARSRNFNILHSNVETLCPALYNSTPAPDVRRRFSDPDPIAKYVVDITERALSFSLDSYDFDAVMKAVIRDGEVVGRGIPRVRYVPTFAPGAAPAPAAPTAPDAPNTQAAPAAATPPEELVGEDVTSEYVPWKYFRRGPGRTWADVPWVAFGDLLTREELRKLCGDAKDKNGNLVADEVKLNYSADQKNRKPGTAQQTIFQRALVWQIWDKDNRRVISICTDYQDAPLALIDDPLGLSGFFPVPRPYQPICTTDSLVPIVPYEIYEDLVAELNEVTSRIAKLIKQLRPRGAYAGEAGDLVSWAEANDGELVPFKNVERFLSDGGLEKAIAWFPLEPTVKALTALVQQRQEIKAIIYEVTGIADIMRGSSVASETAAAQQIKAQWGSLRIQDRQQEVARVARDLLDMKGEIVASKFSWETLTAMTGIDLPTAEQKRAAQAQIAQAQQQMQQMPSGAPDGMPGAAPPQPIQIPEEIQKLAQGPTREDVMAVLRSDLKRRYRIDIESDSTIRGDLARNQQVMSSFLQGTAQFAQAMGPIIMQFPAMVQPAMEVYSAFARQFKLGKQAEDALDALAGTAKSGAMQPQEKPDPKLEADRFRADAARKQTELDMAFAEKKHGMDMEKLDRESARDAQKAALAGAGAQPQQPVPLPSFPYDPNAPTGVPGAVME